MALSTSSWSRLRLSCPTYSVLKQCCLRVKSLQCTGNLIVILQRHYSKNKYSDTVLLPKSKFVVRVNNESRVQKDEQIQETGNFSDLYYWQQQRDEFTGEFCIHDGPPYANGKPHIGHAVNRILKDITNRYKLLRGYKIHYVPGWDCHGLPIELKALEHGSKLGQGSAMDIRRRAREFAEQTIDLQKEAFKKWGVMADWKNCYCTFNPEYITSEIKGFYKLYEKGLIFRDYKPVYWSPYARTALAEAELDYDNNFESKSVFVKYLLTNLPEKLRTCDDDVHALIWTTTPWTLPANKAICFNANVPYSIVQGNKNKSCLMVASQMLPSLADVIGEEFSIKTTIGGDELVGIKYHNPFCIGEQYPFIASTCVTMDKGTGLVHCAPAHGYDDYKIGLQNNLSNECLVDEDGKYTEEAGSGLFGKFVLTEGNKLVIDMLKDDVIHEHQYTHSYPLDWRTKKPIIIRSCKQWFINTDLMKDSTKEKLKDVTVYPESFKGMLLEQIDQRPYWCISRQRKWGVPIPVFYNEQSGQPLLNQQIVEHICHLIHTQGPDCWWKLPVEDLLPQEIKDEHCQNGTMNLVKGEDILDIWFDSGMSWKAVLGNERPADYYLEGVDQIRGWFQSSVLTSTAISGDAPYKNIYIHGFALDEKGRKMSKSLGNTIDPSHITDGGKKNKKTEPAYGVDVLRWWVALHATGRMNIKVSRTVITDSQDNVLKLRLIFKFLLGALNGFNVNTDGINRNEMSVTDRYMLHLIYNYSLKISRHYDDFSYHKVAQLILNFITTDVSGLYCHIIKDRLYCDGEESMSRRSCQTVLHHLLDSIVRSVVPILPHLGEEVAQHHPYDKESVFKTGWITCKESWNDVDVESIMKNALEIRSSLNKSVKGNLREMDVRIVATGNLYHALNKLQEAPVSNNSSLCELLQVSTVMLNNSDNIDGYSGVERSDVVQGRVNGLDQGDFWMLLAPAHNHLCARCRKYTSGRNNDPCQRCLEVMGEQWK